MNATINGSTLHYVTNGREGATPVLFLHGFPFSHAMWSDQLALVGKEFFAIAYDIKGHGNSDVDDGQYTIESHVDDLIGMLDHLKIQQVIVVGLSMGGYITLRALERNPERFRAAVLCDTRSEPDSTEGRIKRAVSARTVKKSGSAAFAAEFVKAVFAAESLTKRAEAVARIRNIIEHTPPLSIAGTLIALAARTDTTPSLGATKVPTLVMVGELDVTTPPSASQAMHDRIPGSELHIMPGAAHMSNLENPTAFNEHLLQFLRRVSQTRP